jgi:hypothetical protein
VSENPFVVALFGWESPPQQFVRATVERLTAAVRGNREVATSTPPDRLPGWEQRLIAGAAAVVAFGTAARWQRVLQLAAAAGVPARVVPLPPPDPLFYPNPTGGNPGRPRA